MSPKYRIAKVTHYQNFQHPESKGWQLRTVYSKLVALEHESLKYLISNKTNAYNLSIEVSGQESSTGKKLKMSINKGHAKTMRPKPWRPSRAVHSSNFSKVF